MGRGQVKCYHMHAAGRPLVVAGSKVSPGASEAPLGSPLRFHLSLCQLENCQNHQRRGFGGCCDKCCNLLADQPGIPILLRLRLEKLLQSALRNHKRREEEVAAPVACVAAELE